MSNRFDEAKAKDKVYDRVYGKGKVAHMSNPNNVSVGFEYFSREFDKRGHLILNNGARAAEATLFYVDGDDNYADTRPVPKVPWNRVPIDTKVITIEGRSKRHYSGERRCFTNGASSFTGINDFAHTFSVTVELAEELTIDGIIYPIGSK